MVEPVLGPPPVDRDAERRRIEAEVERMYPPAAYQRMLTVWVPGVPVTQGSKRHVGGGRMIETSTGLHAWRDTVAWHARAAHHGPPLPGPVAVDLGFWLLRPASHTRANGTLTPTAPTHPIHKQDLDKLTRACLDALTTAGIWIDDGQVVDLTAHKLYARDARTGVDITIREAQP